VDVVRRALILVENLPVPTDRRVWQQALALTAEGIEVMVVCPQGTARDTEAYELRDGVRIHRYPAHPAEGGIGSYVREYGSALHEMRRLIRRLAAEGRIDVIQACNPPDVLLLAARSARRNGTAFIFDQHDLTPEQFRSHFGDRRLLLRCTLLAERLAYHLADVVMVTNDSYKQVALRRGKKATDDVFVVRNAPDPERFRLGEPDPALKNGVPFLIGFVGLMGPQDGVDHSLRALAELRRRRSDWRAIFVGEGDVVDDMRALCAQLQLTDLVDFAGWMSGDRLITTLSTFDVCLAPNPTTPLNDISTMVKLLEYMAMSKPVVAYDLPETRRTAEDAVRYARPDDPASMAEAIDALLDDPELRSRMGATGRARIEGVLSWNNARANLLAAYERAFAVADGRRDR
jgi:glycosyltransferase involved in cell wall biosynthesis